jgi:enamine deaminase RidA (YjgF/YER057c/UK114 family)
MLERPLASRFRFDWARDLQFSQSIRTGHLVITSGQTGMDDGGRLPDAFEDQLRQAFRNLDRVLREQGSSLDGVLRLNTYLADAGDYAAFKAIRGEFLRPPYPASTGVVVGFLIPGMLCELEAIAVRNAIRESDDE